MAFGRRVGIINYYRCGDQFQLVVQRDIHQTLSLDLSHEDVNHTWSFKAFLQPLCNFEPFLAVIWNYCVWLHVSYVQPSPGL